MITHKKAFIVFSFLFSFFAFGSDAATLSLLPEARTFGIGQELSVDIKINTEDASVNAAEATIRFPASILELTSADKVGSAFNFWVGEPTISNEEGTLQFTGGTAKGISGGSLQILKMKFKAKGVGLAELTLHDAAVTASDGKGTNVLSALKGTSITVGTTIVPEAKPLSPAAIPVTPVTPALPVAPPIVEAPTRIVREPVLAKGLPKKPELRVPLYPDESRWYNYSGEVVVFWSVPEDVIDVATGFNKSPFTKPQIPKKELFTGESFGVLDQEGVWYMHIRFRNNVGWGDTAHYKISLDTTAPRPFEINMDALVSDNPTPEVSYETQDTLSGISHALLFLNGKEPLKSTAVLTTLPPQPPGKHALLIRVFDFAGNSIEDDLEFEILSLPLPTIDFVTKTVSQGESVFASGNAIPNAFIDVKIFNAAGREVLKGTAATNAAGNWEFIAEASLDRGKYTLSAMSRDERGATSYSTEATGFQVKAKTVIALGPIDLGWFEIFILMVLLVASGVSITAWYYVSAKKTREAYRIIIGRDVEKLSSLLVAYVEKLEGPLKGLRELADPTRFTEATALVDKIKETIAKIKKYIGGEIRRLK